MLNNSNMEKDNILLSTLRYKKIGAEINKLEFHLKMANQYFTNLKAICKQTENETNVKMCFLDE
jgi:hypothetical protein